ncbi:hypothetical protein PoB_000892700, partial [Plakobranchus ocellatus]
SNCTWKRHFDVPGVLAVVVSLYGRGLDTREGILRSALVVEEPIKRLRILGPSDVAIACDHDWKAVVEKGSHILYQWSLDEVSQNASVSNTFSQRFPSVGRHVLRVTAFNDLGSVKTSITFSVTRPNFLPSFYQNVTLSVGLTLLGEPTVISVLVKGEKHFNISCDFGDGQTGFFSSTDLKNVSSHTSSSSSPSSQLSLPLTSESKVFSLREVRRHRNGISSIAYQVDIRHTFQTAGRFNVSVAVSNGLSEIFKSRQAVVEPFIGDIKLFTNSSNVISIDDELVVSAEVGSGKNLQFAWNFSDNISPNVVSDGNTSRATHIFNVPKTYRVSLTVSNHLQPFGVNVSLPKPITVVTPVSSVSFKHIRSTEYKGSDWSAPLSIETMKTSEVTFEAWSYGSSVNFTFEFGDGGEPVNVEGREHPVNFKPMIAAVKHNYTQVGVFKVRLTASNALGNVSDEHTFTVQTPPSGLRVVVSNACLKVGQMLLMNASIDAGTDVRYNWTLGDQTELIDAGTHAKHRYLELGYKNITVTAYNLVDREATFRIVYVVEEILDVTLASDTQVAVEGEPIQYLASVHPPSASHSTVYSWTFSYRKHESHYTRHPKHSESTTITGRHFVRVEAKNCLGSVESDPVSVQIEARIERLEIEILEKGSTSETVGMKASFYLGTSIVFTWDFGDGSPLLVTKSTKGKSVGNSDNGANKYSERVWHNYTQVGEYTVTLVANNSVSRQVATKKFFILSEPCHAPIISIASTSGQMIQNKIEISDSEFIDIETKVTISCSNFSGLQYRWEILDKRTSQPVDYAFPLAADAKLKKYFEFPDLSLPPGALGVNQYLIRLRVQTTGTEIPVYSQKQRDLIVSPSFPVSHIYGGVYRMAGQRGIISLDGRRSGFHYGASSPVSYAWSCEPPDSPSIPCFNQNASGLELNHSQLHIPVEWFSSVVRTYNFSLRVSGVSMRSDKARGHRRGKKMGEDAAFSSQVISIKPETDVVDVFLECLQCFENMVNSHSKISVRAFTPLWPLDKSLTFTWKVSYLAGEEGVTGGVRHSPRASVGPKDSSQRQSIVGEPEKGDHKYPVAERPSETSVTADKDPPLASPLHNMYNLNEGTPGKSRVREVGGTGGKGKLTQDISGQEPFKCTSHFGQDYRMASHQCSKEGWGTCMLT